MAGFFVLWRNGMMKKVDRFHDYVVHDLLGDIEGVSSRRMFGGYGIYQNGVIFALIADGELYFKVGESNLKDYRDAGSKPFTYSAKNKKRVAMSYWELPSSVMEEPKQIELWVQRSVKASKER